VAPYFALSDSLVALRNYGFAAELIRAGLAKSPKWADRLDRHGVYAVKGDLEKHLKEVTRFAEVNPRAPEAWFLLGYLRMTSGIAEEKKAAADAFRRVLDLSPDDDLARRYLEKK
jgi:predicted TPR repeat methyltransferase